MLPENYLLASLTSNEHPPQCVRQILHYLLPLRLLRGQLPSSNLLDLFPQLAQLYTPFLAAIRTADLKGYDAALLAGQKRLVESGVWLILERGREVVVRGVFKDV